MSRKKIPKSSSDRPEKRKPPREEAVIFSELAELCASPGFAHAIAYFCYRDNLVRYTEKILPRDFAHMHSGSRLIRTEISTLIGLLARKRVDYKVPDPRTVQMYVDRAETLLQELHEAMSSVWFKDFDPEKFKNGGPDPLSTGLALREPIFYGGDSAYSFQYRDFIPKKYVHDKDWLLKHKGFYIDAALTVANALGHLLIAKQTALPTTMRSKPPHEWSYLPAFSFSLGDLAECAKLEVELGSGLTT
jgi:hypothetical protein